MFLLNVDRTLFLKVKTKKSKTQNKPVTIDCEEYLCASLNFVVHLVLDIAQPLCIFSHEICGKE